MERQVPAVVLAGGLAKPEFAARTGVPHRALLKVGENTMLERVVAGLRSADAVGDVAVITDLETPPGTARIGDQGSFQANLFAGLEWARDAPHVLVSTCDIPFVTGEAIRDFVEKALAADADLVYCAALVERCHDRFPGVRRTAVRLREGALTGGNVVLARPAFMLRHRDRIVSAYAARKSPWRLARMFGPRMLLRLVLNLTVRPGLVSVSELESAAGRALGGRVRAVITDYPELATDIDRPEDAEALRNFSGG